MQIASTCWTVDGLQMPFSICFFSKHGFHCRSYLEFSSPDNATLTLSSPVPQALTLVLLGKWNIDPGSCCTADSTSMPIRALAQKHC